MPVEYEKLLNYPIPEIRQRYTAKETILYALSVGLGQDPVDRRQLDFVDHHRALKALPSMATVLGHPGFWLRNPKTGVDAVRLVHGEQAIAIHRPLPPEGEIVGRTRVTGLVDKGEGRGALLYWEKEIVDAATSGLLATASGTTFLRGDGGFGGPSGPVRPPHAMPTTDPDIVVELPTRPEQALFYRLNGDDNPLHADPDTAKAAGFEVPILHGLCTFGVVTHALLKALTGYDTRPFHKMELRFSGPVMPGETIRTEIWRDGSFRALAAERGRIVVDNGLVTLR